MTTFPDPLDLVCPRPLWDYLSQLTYAAEANTLYSSVDVFVSDLAGSKGKTLQVVGGKSGKAATLPFSIIKKENGKAAVHAKSALYESGNNESELEITNLADFETTPADGKYIGLRYVAADGTYSLVDSAVEWNYAPKIGKAQSTSLGPDVLGNEQFDVEPVSWVKPIGYFTTADDKGFLFSGNLFLVQLVTTHLQLFAYGFGPEAVAGIDDGSMFYMNYPFPR